MNVVLYALGASRAATLAEELDVEGIRVQAALSAGDDIGAHLAETKAILVPATRAVITRELISACDRAGVRIVALGDGESRLLARYGLIAPLPADSPGWRIAEVLTADAPALPSPPSRAPDRVIAVWGPHGAPGRSTVAIQLAVELARSGRRTALIDADTVAPSIALLLGLADDAPGVAAACRRAELGGLDAAELTRLASSLETAAGTIDVLAGVNRPSRWPELSSSRLRATLQVSRGWAQETVVDVSGEFESDEEASSDMLGPRRHAATLAALHEADLIVAVASADPLGISRFLRDHAELRSIVGTTPVVVVANRVRPGPLGIDARGQIRRTLDRFGGIGDVTFLPQDQRAADAALLHARPMTDVTPRSAFVAAMRRLAAGLLAAEPAATVGSSRGSSRAARSLRSARALRAESRFEGGRESPS